MIPFKKLSIKWKNLQKVDQCFYFQRKLMNTLGIWPQRKLMNLKFITTYSLLIAFVLSAKINYLRKAIITENYKQVAIVIPELNITLGYFWVHFLMVRTEKVLKLLLDEFEIEWNLCKIHEHISIIEKIHLYQTFQHEKEVLNG